MVDVSLPLQLIKRRFDTELLFTDTDSLTYEIKSEDVYDFKHKHLFDDSHFGKMKVLYKGIQIC